MVIRFVSVDLYTITSIRLAGLCVANTTLNMPPTAPPSVIEV